MASLPPLKYFISRKWGGLLKVFIGLALLYGTFIVMTYFSYGNNESITNMKENKNTTTFPFQDIIATNENVIQIIKKPTEFQNVISVPIPIKIGEILPNCGLKSPCKDNEFSVHIYTGKDHNDQPKLCVDGKYIISKEINGGGRGINVAVIDNVTQTVVRVSHFDTYERDSTALETLLLTLRPGDIIILLTFDEPTRKLSRVARLLLHELGSALIQNLYYRGSWFMVSQKGITGFSPFEELHLVEAGGWSLPHDDRFCVPLKLEGQPVHPDPLPRENKARQEFCDINGNFPHFCDIDVINDPLFPAPVIKQSLVSNKIYSTPILVLSGENIHFLPLTLETIIRQAGINPSIVVVYYISQHQEVLKLVDLFGFMSEEFLQDTNYCDQIYEALETTELLFPDAKHFIILEEGVMLSPDFMSYLGQLLPLLDKDPSIISISAWNDNGFQGVSGDPAITYRVETFPGVAFVIKRNFFHKDWCLNSSNDWSLSNIEVFGETIIPDLSRVLLMNINNTVRNQNNYQQSLISEKRITSMEDDSLLHKVENLQQKEYEHQIRIFLNNATLLSFDMTTVMNCCDAREQDELLNDGIANLFPFLKLNSTGQTFVLYYQQSNRTDYENLKLLCRCFGLSYNSHQLPRGLHNNMLRFTWKNCHVFLIGSTSPYYSMKIGNNLS